jgi:outer membrane protein assembly factor BamB
MPSYLQKEWEYYLGKDLDSRAYAVSMIVTKQTLIMTQNWEIYAFDLDGNLLWEFIDERPDFTYPAATKNNIYAGNYDSILSVDLQGEKSWKVQYEYSHFTSSTLIFDDSFVIGPVGMLIDCFGPNCKEWEENMWRGQRRLVCLDIETGDLKWEFYVGSSWRGILSAYLDGKVYVRGGSSEFYCLDAETGDLIWRKGTRELMTSNISIDEDYFYVGTYSDGVYCHDRMNGDVVWNYECDGYIYMTPALGYENIFFGTDGGAFYCLDRNTGEKKWDLQTGEKILSHVIIADERVLFGTQEGNLYMLDAFSGKILSSYALGGSGISSLILSHGKIFVGEYNGRVTCFGEGQCTKEFPYPLLSLIILIPLLVFLFWWKMSRI